MNRARLTLRRFVPLALIASALLVQACGGGGGGQGATPAPGGSLARGAAIKGPLDGAQVRLFAIDDAGFATGPALATVVTDAEGRFTFERAANGPALIAVTRGGSFVDESDTAPPAQRRRIVLGAQEGFESMLPAGSSTLVITPYTHARLLQVRRAANGENFLGFFAAAREASIAAFGYDPYDVLPESPLAPAADAGEAAIQYAMAIGGAAYVIQAQSLALGTIPTYATVRAFIDDLSDGRIDGRLDGASIFVAVDGRMLALPDSVSLNGQLLRFVNNNFDLYGGQTAARIDEDQLAQVPAPDNRAPQASADAYETDAGMPLSIAAPGVLGNDTDADGDPLTAVVDDAPDNGSLVLSADGGFVYTPAEGFSGTDRFSYRASDGEVSSNAVNVTVVVGEPAGEAPVAVADVYGLDEDTELNVSVPGVLANDLGTADVTTSANLVATTSNGLLTLVADGSFAYQPNADFNGEDSFRYRAANQFGESSEVTVRLNVDPVNDRPVAVADSYSVGEDQELLLPARGVLTNDLDIDGDLLRAVLVEGPANGTLELGEDGALSYRPGEGFSGTDSFRYRADDGSLQSAPVRVTIRVASENDAPVAEPDSYTTPEDQALVVAAPGLLANDTDAESDTLSASLVTSPQHGVVALSANGAFTYTPAADFVGEDSFTYQAGDGNSLSPPTVVTIDVTAVNDAPVAADDRYATEEDTLLAVMTPGVLANDVDGDGPVLSAVLVEGPQHGQLSLAADGGFTYLPEIEYTGPDQFTYRAEDGERASEVATVQLTVGPVGDPPVAGDDAYSANEGQTVNIAAPGVLDNDSDSDDNALTAVLVQGPANGLLALSPSGGFTYTHNGSETSSDSFVYRADDGISQSANATVTLSITPVNDPPVAIADAYGTNEDTVLVVPARGVLLNDSDPDSPTLTAVLDQAPTRGALTLSANGGFTYTPQVNLSGPDSFTYRASDGTAQSAPVTVTINVLAVNDAPVAVLDQYNGSEDTVLTVAAPGVLTNDADPEGSALTAVLATGPAQGALNLAANGSFSYTPAANFAGNVSFTYRARDAGGLLSAPVTVSLGIAPVNDAPVATNDSYNATEDTLLTVSTPGVLGNDTDADGPSLSAVLVAPPATGMLNLAANGGFTYMPAANASGVVSFTYRASDGTAQSNIASATITIAAVNDAPVADDDSYNATEDTALVVPAASGVLVGDTDADGQALTAVLVSPPATGLLNLAANGGFTYTPVANASGAVTFTYRASDGAAQSNIATVTINIAAVNDAPVADDDSYNATEDTALVVPAASGVLVGDTDVEGSALTAVVVSPPATGALNLAANGGFTYTPAANANGVVSFTYRASDGAAQSNIATVTITIAAVDDAPLADADSYNATEDTALVVPAGSGVLVGDTDADGQALTAVLVAPPATGSLNLAANGGFTYTPAANANGAVTFTYRASDGTSQSSTATVTLTIAAVNDVPVADNDSYDATEDTALVVAAGSGVLVGDTDADGQALTAVLVSPPATGTLNLAANGGFTYTPAANASGVVSFTYRASDGTAQSNTVTVTITIAAVNDAPVAVNDSYQTTEGQGLAVIVASGVLANDTDPDGSPPTTAVLADDLAPAAGTLVFNANGSFSYEPAGGFVGMATFTYRARDAALALSNLATVTIEVLAQPNTAPVANNDVYSTDEDTTLEIASDSLNKVLENDTDADDDSLTAQLVSNVATGTLNFASDGSFNYTPAANASGPVTFTYRANDGTVNSNVATVTINVVAQNDLPTLSVVDGLPVPDAGSVLLTPAHIIADDVEDNDPADLTVAVSNGPSNGDVQELVGGDMWQESSSFTMAQVTANQVRYLANSGEGEADSFDLRVTDSDGGMSPIRTFSVEIQRQNDAPVITAPTSIDGGLFGADLAGIQISDPDAGTELITVTLQTANTGDLEVDGGVVGGVSGAQITDNGTVGANNSVTIDSTQNQINTTLSDPDTVRLDPLGKLGPRNLTVIANDNGESGLGGAQESTENVNVRIKLIPPPDGVSTPSSGTLVRGGDGNDLAGRSVTGIGDFNGDGIDDFAIGAPGVDSDRGEVYVIFGVDGGLPADILLPPAPGQGIRIVGAASGDMTGFSVSHAVDFNDDTRDDLVIGAPGANGDSGSVHVIFGFASPGVTPSQINLPTLSNQSVVINGNPGDQLGYSVGGRNTNPGSPVLDLVIGAPGADPGGSNSGAAYLINGYGFSGTYGIADLNVPSSFLTGVAISGLSTSDRYGHSVAHLGDVNNDGVEDYALGSPAAAGSAGSVAIVVGDPSPPESFDLATLDGSNGTMLIGNGGDTGHVIAAAGDLNNDSFDDIVVGAPGADGGDGRAYVVFGAGGFSPTIALNSIAIGVGFRLSGDAAANGGAGWSVAGGVDLDDDGLDDLLVGTESSDIDPAFGGGEVYVLFGSGALDNQNSYQGSSFDGSQGAVIRGLFTTDGRVDGVAAAGDVDNDGREDAVLGASEFEVGEGGADRGAGFLIRGRDLR